MINIQETTRFFVIAKLCPRKDFKPFFQCSNPAGQCHKSVCQFRHKSFPLMHGFHNMEFCKMIMCDFHVPEFFRDDSDDISVSLKASVGYGPHTSNSGAAID